jgi:hypothetical protein
MHHVLAAKQHHVLLLVVVDGVSWKHKAQGGSGKAGSSFGTGTDTAHRYQKAGLDSVSHPEAYFTVGS